MSHRTDLIEAKIAGKFQDVVIEKLSSYVKSYQDYADLLDIIEEKTASVDPTSVRNLLVASALIGGGSLMGAHFMQLRNAHKSVKEQLLQDPAFPDKAKLEKLYDMISKFAPRVSANHTFAKSVMEQLYNAPMVSAPMVEQIVNVERGIKDSSTIIPHTKDIITSAGSIGKAVV